MQQSTGRQSTDRAAVVTGGIGRAPALRPAAEGRRPAPADADALAETGVLVAGTGAEALTAGRPPRMPDFERTG
jgi:hypothetical protein